MIRIRSVRPKLASGLVGVTAVAAGALLLVPPAAGAAPTHAVSVTASITRSQTLIGRPVAVSGTVSRHVAGERIRLQRASGKRWVTIATAPISGIGAFLVATPKTLGPADYVLRAAVPPVANLVGANARLSLAVVRWRHLSDLRLTEAGVCTGRTVDIAGNPYANSLYWTVDHPDRCQFGHAHGDGVGEYDLGRRCVQFAGNVGITDTSPADGRAGIAISSDSRVRFDRVLARGKNTPVILDLARAARLRFAVTLVDPGHGSDLEPAVGDARVLCAS